MSVTLLIPTYNEIDGMRVIMPQVKKEWCDQIIVADGGSTDGTVEYAKEHGYDIVPQDRWGLVNAYRTAFPYIKGDYVLTFSPDGNSSPPLIPKLIAKISEGYDLVVASRYLDDAKSDDDTFMTRLGNWTFTALVKLLFRSRTSDSLNILRIYRTDVIKEMGLLHDRKFGLECYWDHLNSWELLSSIRVAKKKLRFAEIPGSEPVRIGGVEKINKYKNGPYGLGIILQELLYWDIVPD